MPALNFLRAEFTRTVAARDDVLMTASADTIKE